MSLIYLESGESHFKQNTMAFLKMIQGVRIKIFLKKSQGVGIKALLRTSFKCLCEITLKPKLSASFWDYIPT